MTSTQTTSAAVTERPFPTFVSRWIVLLGMSVAVYGSYYAFDYIGPLVSSVLFVDTLLARE